jgi:hypothetical protein
MKKQLKKYIQPFALVLILLAMATISFAQENTDSVTIKLPKYEPVLQTFASNLIIDNQTNMVPDKKTFEFVIQHRFGVLTNGIKDVYGIVAPSNIRLGLNYTPINNLQVGFGFTKERIQLDGNVKYAIFKQTTGGGSPVSLTYFGDITVDARSKKNFLHGVDRFSFFNQLIIARKVTKNLSLQVAPSFSWFNNVEAYVDSKGIIQKKMKNGHFAISFAGRYKITEKMSVIAGYDQPLTEHTTNNPNPNISFGIELATSTTHTFQVFLGNYQSIVPEANNVKNRNNYKKGEYLIGLNISKR